MEYCSAPQKKEILPFAMKLMELESAILSEKPRPKHTT